MGTLGNAFKRELGKNTGKFVSNVIFGDGHSTPYRRVDKAREANANARQQMAEARKTNANARLQMAEARMEIAEAQAQEARERSKRERKNQIYAVDSAVLENIDLLNSQAIPTDKQELLQFLSVLAVQLKATPWLDESRDDEAKIRNKYTNALLEKFRLSVYELETTAPDDPHLQMYKELLSQSNKKRFLANSLNSQAIPTDKQELLQFLSVLAVQLKATSWLDESREANALLEKFRLSIYELETAAPDDPHLQTYKNLLSQSNKKRFLAKHKRGIIILSCAFAILILVVFCAIPLPFGVILLFLLKYALIIGGIVVLFFLIKYLIKHPDKLAMLFRKNTPNEKPKESVSIPPAIHPEPVATTTVPEAGAAEEESIFFDLNNDGRIEKELAKIWNRYRRLVGQDIIGHKPIFSADGVKDSILFVGVNPSYNPADDSTLIPSQDNSSLMYGSFYKLNNAPDYFKSLEEFASKAAGKAYTHINLLYARANDRDALLRCNSDFIREQLELTYNTILKIQPAVIIFFSDYCKELIFGADRWIDPDTECDGHYTLRGTRFPAFFTDDVTVMDNPSKTALISKIRSLI